MIEPTTHRNVFRHHDAVCASCHELFVFARNHGDREALDAWRRQLAAHLENGQAQQEHAAVMRRTLDAT